MRVAGAPVCRRLADFQAVDEGSTPDVTALGGEPACGAALAVAYERLPVLAPFQRPLRVVCGGIAVDLAKLAVWSADRARRRAPAGERPAGP